MIIKYKKLKQWSVFLAILPFSILFVIGVLWGKNYLDITLNIENYKSGYLIVDDLSAIVSENGSNGVVVLGMVDSDSVRTSINLSPEEENKINESQVSLVGQSFRIWYRNDGVRTIKNSGIYSSFEEYFYAVTLYNFIIQTGLLIAPFCICVFIYLYSSHKLRNDKN